MLTGRLTVDYGDREDSYGPGDAFYMTPGHVPTAEAGSEFVQFSPKEQLRVTVEAIQAAMAGRAEQGQAAAGYGMGSK